MKLKAISFVLAVALVLCVAPGAWGAARYKVIHSFGSGKDGAVPSGPLVFDSSGNLYGVTGGGGTGQCSDGCGMVFRLVPNANGEWKESILHKFTAGKDGAIPWGSLVFDSNGKLYGTVQGDNGLGGYGVFELSPESNVWVNSLIYNDGAGPGLLIDAIGHLYGDMAPGQYKYSDAIAELSPGSKEWLYTVLYSFCGPNSCRDGESLAAPPIWDAKGNMFGATTYGGIGQPICWTSLGCGVVFEMTPNKSGTWDYHVLHRFLELFLGDGQSPYGGVVLDASGNLYGTTAYGGAYKNGMVFELSPVSHGWQFTILYDFPDCSIGCAPAGNLVFDKEGNLYGVNGGGLPDCVYDCGVLFKLSPQKNGKWKYSVLHKFTGKDGNFPGYGLTIDNKGNLFGVTTAGGKYYEGVAFELTP